MTTSLPTTICGSPTARRLAAAGLAAVLLLGATGCGQSGGSEGHGGHDGGSGGELSSTEHNAADVQFASDMLQHHAQALSMVDLTQGRPLDPEVEQLAEAIREAQGPEIETFTDWLTEWDEEVPATMRDHAHAGHGGGDVSESMEDVEHGDMPGMMSAEDMQALEEASDAEFQARWLEMMVEHHDGAIEMAEAEKAEGRYQPAVHLAEHIADSQADEVETMQRLLEG